jgi:hypothetical protein
MLRRGLWLLFGLFLVTRLSLVYVGADPSIYQGRDHQIGADVSIYAGWADEIVERNRLPYRDVPIEYPPGSLPFIVAPAVAEAVTGVPYRVWFAGAMVSLDLLGLLALLRVAARGGSQLGPWLWVVGLALLGPVVWARLDLVPAVATLWAIERIAAGAWNTGAALLAFGALAKVYPGFLIFPTAVAAPRRMAFLSVGAAVLVVGLAPFAALLPELSTSVAGYHLQRGVQLESTWGSGLLLANLAGTPATVAKRFGAWEVLGASSSTLSVVSTVLVIGVLAVSMWLVAHRRGDVPLLTDVWFTTLALLLVAGRVLSPQFIVWLVAVGAGAVAMRGSSLRAPVLLLLPIALVTHLVYPITYDGLVAAEPESVLLLASRNALLVAAAGWALLRVARAPSTA